MKKIISGVILFSASSLFSLNSCKKVDAVIPVASATGNVAAIKADPSLTIFSIIESKSIDDSLFNRSISILAPVDSAFINAGITAAVAAALSTSACDSIIKYYTTAGTINFGNTVNAETGFISSLGSSFFADSSTTAKYFNGVATVSASPTIAGTSSIYKLTQFINVPKATVAQITAADTTLSLFNEALNVTNLTPNLATGSFTLLMPTNAAFAAAGYPTIASIDSANINTLNQILLYHVIANNYFENDIALQTTLNTMQGSALQVSNNGVLKLTGNSDPGTPASFLSNGIFAGNVLAYKIDTVLLP